MFNLKVLYSESCRLMELHQNDLELTPLAVVVHFYQQFLVNEYRSVANHVSLFSNSTISERNFNRQFGDFSELCLQLVVHTRLLSHKTMYVGLQKKGVRHVDIREQQRMTYEEAVWDLRNGKQIGFVASAGNLTICRFQDADLELEDFDTPLSEARSEIDAEIREMEEINTQYLEMIKHLDPYKKFPERIPFV